MCLLIFSLKTTQSQTIIYADSVIAFSNEYSSAGWHASQILHAPDVYPACNDLVGSWTFPAANQREWIELYYNTAIKVDSINIFETNHSGVIDTVYLRDAQTLVWHTVYNNTAFPNTACEVLKIGFSTTSYSVNAVRFTISNSYYSNFYYPEYDAVALINNGAVTGTKYEWQINDNVKIYPNPSCGNVYIESKNTLDAIVTDVLGNAVMIVNLKNGKTFFSTENLNAGIYFVKFSDGFTQKFVVNKN